MHKEEISIRKALVSDAQSIARLKIDGWRSTFKGIVSQNYLDALDVASQRARMETLLTSKDEDQIFLVASDQNGDVLGFCCGGKNRGNEEGYDGELWAIFVDATTQGLGVGRQLVNELMSDLRALGFRRMIVWCLADNPFCRFYEKMGASRLYAKKHLIGDDYIMQNSFGWDI